MNKKQRNILLPLLALASGIAGAQTVTTDFTNGDEGWFGPNGFTTGTTVEPTGGNGGAFMRTEFEDLGISIQNTSNSAFLGDYTQSQEVTVSVDLRVENMSDSTGQVSNPWVLELRDFDGAQDGFLWNSVWLVLDQVSAAGTGDWTTFSVTFDPTLTRAPDGWGGTGAFNDLGDPVLPSGVSFSDVLSGVDAIVFTTQQPGLEIPLTSYIIGVDNISITRVVPTPSALALLGLGGIVGTRRKR